MKTLLGYTFAAVLVLTGTSLSQSANSASAREKFIGAWHLAWMESQGADGKLTRVTNVKGMLLYTRDGHMSVQLMFPEPQYALSNDYVKNRSFLRQLRREQRGAHDNPSRAGIDHCGARRQRPHARVPVFW